MTHSQFFGDRQLTREPSSFRSLDNGPCIDSYPVHLSQKDVSYPYSYNDVSQTRRPAQPRILSDTPSLDAFFYEPPAFGVSGSGEHTASTAPIQQQHGPSAPGADQITRSSSSPEKATHSDRSAPVVSASQSEHGYSTYEASSCALPAPLKKSSSAQATFSSLSQDDNGLSRQSSQHGSVHETSNQSDYVPSFPQPQHHHYPSHASTTPLPYASQPMYDFSESQRYYPQGGHARNDVDQGPRSPPSSFQQGPAMREHPSRAGEINGYRRQYSNGSLIARDIRPDMQSFEAMLQALQDFGACKEIFDSMGKELDQINTNARKGEFETGLIAETNALREASTEALQSAERLVNSYDGFARALDKRLADIAHSHSSGGGMLFPCEDIDVLSVEITLSASALTQHVEKMQDRVRGLLTLIDNLKDKRDQMDRRRKIWRWLERALAIMSTVFTAGACVAPLFGPYGLIAGAVMAGAAPLCLALSTLCKKQAESLTEEKKLDNFLIFLRENLLTEAKAAEIKLTSFPPLQLVHRAALDARSNTSRGWISAEEANRARFDWSEWFRRFDQEKSAKQNSSGYQQAQYLRNATLPAF